MAAPKVSGIYEIVNLVSGNRYVGSARNIRVRWSQHKSRLNRGTHHSPPLQAAWRKYGAESFEFRLLRECLEADLVEVEQRYLDHVRPAYNVAKAAGYRTFLGLTHSPETIAKMSEAHRGNTRTKGKPRNPEAVAATAAAHRGRKRSPETRAKIAAKAKGRTFVRSEEYRAAVSARFKGVPKSEQHLAALQNGRRNRVYTDEQRLAIGEASRRAWAKRKAASL